MGTAHFKALAIEVTSKQPYFIQALPLYVTLIIYIPQNVPNNQSERWHGASGSTPSKHLVRLCKAIDDLSFGRREADVSALFSREP